MGVFNSKTFNSEVFGKYLETVPRVKQNAFLKAGILRNRADLKSVLTEQVGGNFITVPMTGRIGGDVLNYDGSTDITATGLETFTQGMIVVGRAKAWSEKDFSFDITGKDFMSEIAKQVGDYWDDVDEATILSTLKGIFGVTVNSFSTSHTLDISAATDAYVGATTLLERPAENGASFNSVRLAGGVAVAGTEKQNRVILDLNQKSFCSRAQSSV